MKQSSEPLEEALISLKRAPLLAIVVFLTVSSGCTLLKKKNPFSRLAFTSSWTLKKHHPKGKYGSTDNGEIYRIQVTARGERFRLKKEWVERYVEENHFPMNYKDTVAFDGKRISHGYANSGSGDERSQLVRQLAQFIPKAPPAVTATLLRFWEKEAPRFEKIGEGEPILGRATGLFRRDSHMPMVEKGRMARYKHSLREIALHELNSIELFTLDGAGEKNALRRYETKIWLDEATQLLLKQESREFVENVLIGVETLECQELSIGPVNDALFSAK